MSNRFKFIRCWDQFAKKFVDGFFIRDNQVYPLCLNFNGLVCTSFYKNPSRTGDLGHGIETIYDQHNFIVQLYTGLKDSKDKEIYEGDIVRFSHNYLIDDAEFVERAQIGIVEFGNDGYSKKMGWQIDQNDDFYGGWPRDLEILGNIFENPELLK